MTSRLALAALFLFLSSLSHATTVTVQQVQADSVAGAPVEGVPALLKDGVFSAPVQMMAPFSTDQKAAARGMEYSQCAGCQLMALPEGFDSTTLNAILTN
jgi:hypothetical protein